MLKRKIKFSYYYEAVRCRLDCLPKLSVNCCPLSYAIKSIDIVCDWLSSKLAKMFLIWSHRENERPDKERINFMAASQRWTRQGKKRKQIDQKFLGWAIFISILCDFVKFLLFGSVSRMMYGMWPISSTLIRYFIIIHFFSLSFLRKLTEK